jgi:hypothetical protein
MNANEMTFGCEFEVTMPAENAPVAGAYHRGQQITGLPEGWNAQSDGSIHCTARGHVGVEIVSPILKGADGIRQIKLVCQWLKANGAKVNQSTGFHVHVGCERNDTLVGRIAHLTANFEKALYAATGTKSRERGHYCQPIQSNSSFQARFVNGQRAAVARYHSLNVTNLDNGTKPTVEFRVFAGTINPLKAIGYIRLCLGLVEKAATMKRTTKWVAKPTVETSPIHRNGDGQTCLTRLFYALGWTKGRESFTFGNVEAEGAPTIKACKKELMKMARKYDAQETGLQRARRLLQR